MPERHLLFLLHLFPVFETWPPAVGINDKREWAMVYIVARHLLFVL